MSGGAAFVYAVFNPGTRSDEEEEAGEEKSLT